MFMEAQRHRCPSPSQADAGWWESFPFLTNSTPFLGALNKSIDRLGRYFFILNGRSWILFVLSLDRCPFHTSQLVKQYLYFDRNLLTGVSSSNSNLNIIRTQRVVCQTKIESWCLLDAIISCERQVTTETTARQDAEPVRKRRKTC